MPDVNFYLEELTTRYPALQECREQIQAAFVILSESYHCGGKLLVCGNGGSAADAEHIVGELMKGFHSQRPLSPEEEEKYGEYASKLQQALPAISLTQHTALNTAFSNDVAPEMVYAQQVYGYGAPGDVFLGISTSGNSANVVHAARVAREKGLKVLSLTGRSGGELLSISDVCIHVPARETYQVQELHLPVYHALCSMLESEFFG